MNSAVRPDEVSAILKKELESFDKEAKGYYYSDGTLQFKNNGSSEILSLDEKYFIYDSDKVKAILSRTDYSVSDIQIKDESVQEVELDHLAEMSFILKNIKNISIFKSDYKEVSSK